MKKFYCFEIATDHSYHVFAHENEQIADENLNAMRTVLGVSQEIDTYAIGTCEATDVDDALMKVRQGDWSYTQKC